MEMSVFVPFRAEIITFTKNANIGTLPRSERANMLIYKPLTLLKLTGGCFLLYKTHFQYYTVGLESPVAES